MSSEKRCPPDAGCMGLGWMWDPQDSGSGRTAYCDCAAGDELRVKDQEKLRRPVCLAHMQPECAACAAVAPARAWCCACHREVEVPHHCPPDQDPREARESCVTLTTGPEITRASGRRSLRHRGAP